MLPRCVFFALLSLVSVMARQAKKKHHVVKTQQAQNDNPENNKTVFLEWNYDEESKWPGFRCQQGGYRQSPIDIKQDKIVVDYQNAFIKHGPLKFKGYNEVLMTGINNGLTVQFSSDGEYSIHPVLSGGPLAHKYRLEQLHFHWLSEHAINGHKYPMEIHLVHVRTDLTVRQALFSKDGLAIISLFCNVQTLLDEDEEIRVGEIMELIPKLAVSGSRISGAVLNLRQLINPTANYFTYAGSLTSPECNEVVTWILFPSPVVISDKQYRLFGKIGEGRHNFRSLQPIRLHMVYAPPPDSVWKAPMFVSVVSNLWDDVSMFFRNVTRFVRRKMFKMTS